MGDKDRAGWDCLRGTVGTLKEMKTKFKYIFAKTEKQSSFGTFLALVVVVVVPSSSVLCK